MLEITQKKPVSTFSGDAFVSDASKEGRIWGKAISGVITKLQ